MAKGYAKLRFGPVTVVPGTPSSVFPRCTSLYVDGGRERAVIDPGAGPEALAETVGCVDLVLNTHYHFDHIWGNHLYRSAAVALNPIERNCFPDLEEVGSRLGIREVYGGEGVREWIEAVSTAAGERAGAPGAPASATSVAPPTAAAPFTPAFRPEWWLSTRTPARAYPYGEFSVGSARLVMIHSPGHTAGFACPYFPDEGLVYTGDIDLTSFGPWYAGSDGDIEAFVRSARALLDLDAEWYLTGHQEGLLRRAEFAERLEEYLGVIDERDRRALDLLAQGLAPEELGRRGLLYGERFHADPWVRMWDALAARKHVERLRRKGLLTDFPER